jgi:hypothetical protein
VSNAGLLAWPTGSVNAGWPSEPRNMFPGMVTGWPSGSQRAASNPAERLLSQAVGWWDAASYRDGDRLLRNRGVAGDLLDLQLGSSDRVATTNDPLFLAPEDRGYVYLPGVTVNFMRVPDENALDITGDIDIRVKVALADWTPAGVTGLVSKWLTTGNQRSYSFRVNTNGALRLDVDCDAITDGSATSFQAVTGQTVTINRSTGNRKSVAVPRRNGGGRSLFLLGGDDYMEVMGNWQHQLLNFEQQDSFTVIAVLRTWLNQADNQAIISKSDPSFITYRLDTTANISSGSNTLYRFVARDFPNELGGNALLHESGGTVPFGSLGFVAFSFRRGTLSTMHRLVSGSEPVRIPNANAQFLRSLKPTGSMIVGRQFGSTAHYINMEFTAAAVFRRALTPDEIKTINDYYQNRGF